MSTARHRQIRLDVTPYYCCTTRCIGKSYLCGQDSETGRNFDHRKDWIKQRLIALSQAFCIEVAAYSILPNHYHVALVVNKEEADSLSDLEVVQRRLEIFKGCVVATKFRDNLTLTDDESRFIAQRIKQWRFELASISKFMSQINEKIARLANKEDGCKGRFWEARFDSQPVPDIDALLRTMAYDGMSPVNANLASTTVRL